MSKILFVCLGNICRSPMAEGIMAAELARRGITGVEIDSAGTGSWHTGEPPDKRATAEVAKRGIDISHLRARQVTSADFDHFDIIIAMDRDNFANLCAVAGPAREHKVKMFLDFAPGGNRDVPDPYYGGPQGFSLVLNLLEMAAAGLCDQLEAKSENDSSAT